MTTNELYVVIADDVVNDKRYVVGPFQSLSVAQAWAIIDAEEKAASGPADEGWEGDRVVPPDAVDSKAWIEVASSDGETLWAWTPIQLIAVAGMTVGDC